MLLLAAFNFFSFNISNLFAFTVSYGINGVIWHTSLISKVSALISILSQTQRWFQSQLLFCYICLSSWISSYVHFNCKKTKTKKLLRMFPVFMFHIMFLYLSRLIDAFCRRFFFFFTTCAILSRALFFPLKFFCCFKCQKKTFFYPLHILPLPLTRNPLFFLSLFGCSGCFYIFICISLKLRH